MASQYASDILQLDSDMISRIKYLFWAGKYIKSNGIFTQKSYDQKVVMVDIEDVTIDNVYIGSTLWISFYKDRSRIEGIWILEEYHQPKLPTVEQLELILQHYHDDISATKSFYEE